MKRKKVIVKRYKNASGEERIGTFIMTDSGKDDGLCKSYPLTYALSSFYDDLAELYNTGYEIAFSLC